MISYKKFVENLANDYDPRIKTEANGVYKEAYDLIQAKAVKKVPEEMEQKCIAGVKA